MRFFLSILSLFVFFQSYGKEELIDTFLVKQEKQINEQLEALRSANNDYEKDAENESLIEMLQPVLAYPGAMDYPFQSFKTKSTIASPDGAFRLFNWNVESDAGLHSHYCFMIIPQRAGKPNQVIQFNEDRITLPPRPENTLTPLHWYGALYYQIVPIKKGSKTLYTVLGYNGAGKSTNKKILDVFYFKGKNIRMGYPIFQLEEGSKKLARRIFFEYSEKVTISVSMEESLDAIVFDHLVPESASVEGLPEFYVPDMTYDGYRWQGTVWEYQKDIIAVNDENRKTRVYNPNGEDEGENEWVEVKDVWINPVDGNPFGGGTSAVAPLEDLETDGRKSKNGRKKKKVARQKKRMARKRKKNQPRSAVIN